MKGRLHVGHHLILLGPAPAFTQILAQFQFALIGRFECGIVIRSKGLGPSAADRE